MNKTLKANREMKDSGIEWIGEIPKEWKLPLLGAHFKERSEKVSDKDYPPLSVTKKGVVPQLENVAKTDNNDNRKKICINDFVINSRSDRKGSSGLSKYEGSTSNISIVLELQDIFPMYAHYLLKSHGFIEEFYRWGSGIVADLWSTRYSSMKKINIPFPPLHEQQIIANYLDEKVGKIDQLIAKQNQSIDKWKEYKQSLITETVTKGLNPNVEMKDSGIEWIGKIPSNWDKRKISNLFTLIGSGTTPTSSDLKYYDDGEIPWLNTGDLNDGYLYTAKNKITSHALNDYSTLKMYPEDTLIVAMYGATIGKLGITTYKTTTNQACCALSNPKNCITKFIFYWFYGNKTEIINLSRGAGQPNISQNIIKNLILFIPPLHEQQAIAEFLDEKVERVDQAIEQKQTLIKQLEEYKQSLIYECVTGKRCVL